MKNIGVNQSIQIQMQTLHEILKQNEALYEIVTKMEQYNLVDYYIGGGAIAQTVWNYLFENPLDYGISDVDIVYYDSDLSKEKEQTTGHSIQELLANNSYSIDVINEARVHLWYEEAFSKKITAYTSVEEAISTWPTTATSIGVRLEGNNLVIFAPYGFNDLFGGTVQPNKKMIDSIVYENKVNKWRKKWPELNYKKW